MLIEAKFEGGLADQHKIPAYDGAKSLEGITRSILIIANFLVEGRVRRRDFGQVPLSFNMVAQRAGSFETIYELAYAASVIGAPIMGDLAGGVAGNLLTDLLRTVYRRVTGVKDQETKSVQDLEELRSGDIEALVDAVEPAVRMAHNVINYGVINININQRNGSERRSIAEFDSSTKNTCMKI